MVGAAQNELLARFTLGGVCGFGVLSFVGRLFHILNSLGVLD